ncbi:MAG: bifunctional homocysteine S-methyltransferase/methylenetetrahydrofolate reductase, partial [Anaerolineae bacterium]|nr:bifunctional homocysteine S-methyltransferase/methylenetetrahydrofolate reductase [Anaerolineae bacterium]
LCVAVQAVQSLSDLPLIAQATFDEDGRTPRGQSAIKVVGALTDLGVDVVGINCSVGPQKVLEVAGQMIAAGAPYVSAMPNAGMPTQSGGRLLYLTTPAYFGRITSEMLALGVRIVGGCCGTTPDHTAAMKTALDAYCKGAQIAVPIESMPSPRVTLPKPEKGHKVAPTQFSQKLRAGKFVTSIELSPPKSFKTGALLRAAQQIADSGVVDAINVTDSPMARVRMSALAACFMIQAQTGMETVIHFTTRDRSLMGIQADLIGAHAIGVRNILALTGDPPSLGTVTEGSFGSSSGVFDVDSIGLARIIGEMKKGQDLTGTEIGEPGGFCLGVAADPTKPDLEAEAARLRAKIEAGAEFIMTQPIYDLDVWHRFLAVFGAKIEIPVLLGLLPLLGDRHAEFLHNEIPGITLSEEALARMRAAGPNGRAEGVKLAQEFLLQAQDEFQGVYLMPSYNRVEIALEVLDVLK